MRYKHIYLLFLLIFKIGITLSQDNTQETKDTLLQLASDKFLKKEYDSLLFYYDRISEIDTLGILEYLNRGIAYYNLRMPEKAIKDLDLVYKEMMYLYNAELMYYRGLTHTALGNYQAAFEDFNSIVKNESSFYYVYNARGKLYTITGKLIEAEKDFNKALEFNKKYADAYAYRGEARMLRAKFDEALNDCNMAISLESKDARYYAIRGKVKMYLKDYQGSILDFENSIRLDSNIISTYSYLIESLNKIKDYKSILKIYDFLISKNSTSASYFFERGKFKRLTGDKEGACEDYLQAKSLFVTMHDDFLLKDMENDIIKEIKKNKCGI